VKLRINPILISQNATVSQRFSLLPTNIRAHQ